MIDGINPWVAGGVAWACLLVGFVLGTLWRSIADANHRDDDVFDDLVLPHKAPPHRNQTQRNQ